MWSLCSCSSGKSDDFDENNQLKLVKLKDGMLKNHGYCATTIDGVECALVTRDEGVFPVYSARESS
ncbi:MAG: hypothetical protein ACLUTU_18165 [Blautia faecis]